MKLKIKGLILPKPANSSRQSLWKLSILSIILIIHLTGCSGGDRPAENPSADATITDKPNQPAAKSTVDNSAALPLSDMKATDKYEYTITYPREAAESKVLRAALTNLSEGLKEEFLSFFEEGLPETESLPWNMTIDYEPLMANGDFISILGRGSMYTGGAHGMPIIETFNYNAAEDRLIELPDLFHDAATMHLIRDYVRKELQNSLNASPSAAGWINEGTEVNADNYRCFTIVPAVDGKAAGISVLFPPYQVASYADGLQEVFVPTEVFASQIKSEFNSAFSTAAASN